MLYNKQARNKRVTSQLFKKYQKPEKGIDKNEKVMYNK